MLWVLLGGFVVGIWCRFLTCDDDVLVLRDGRLMTDGVVQMDGFGMVVEGYP